MSDQVGPLVVGDPNAVPAKLLFGKSEILDALGRPDGRVGADQGTQQAI